MSQTPYRSDAELLNALDIPSWRNLDKETFRRFLHSLPEIDRELALKLTEQIPEITKLAQAVLDDEAKAHDATLTSIERGMERVHQIHCELLRISEAQLDKNLTPEQWLHVFEFMRAVESNALLKETETKSLISALHHWRRAKGLMIFLGVIALAFAGGRSAHSLSNQ